jgi:hypothetical protein
MASQQYSEAGLVKKGARKAPFMRRSHGPVTSHDKNVIITIPNSSPRRSYANSLDYNLN